MTITLVLEILVMVVLGSALLYFVFDVKDILVKLLVSIICIIGLIVFGFFLGIGVHLTNLAFGW